MTVVATTTSYAGRTVDIELMQSVQTLESPQRMELSFSAQATRIVTGAQKLIQRYALLFLSTIGTVRFDMAQGTSLIASVISGAVQTTGGVNIAFADANQRVLQQLVEEDQQEDLFGELPDDETLVNAVLISTDIDYAQATLFMRILLTTAAGDNIVFVLPVTATR